MRPAQSPQNNLGLERRPGSPGRGPAASTPHSITGAVKCIVSGVHNLTIRGSEAQKTFIWDYGIIKPQTHHILFESLRLRIMESRI